MIMENIIDLKRIGFDEKLAFSLRGIYEGYGYLPYNMSKFEEYELYSKNKDFLVYCNCICHLQLL